MNRVGNIQPRVAVDISVKGGLGFSAGNGHQLMYSKDKKACIQHERKRDDSPHFFSPVNCIFR